ncbi:hypothetical protein CEUSTIGMA_g9293.t1 [Chlamydomonas eustigma]|uniref:RNase H type-1 domain-containing protein n=1 Tax=Chlamydomonas eustigma TaxID=1157962 RepID=A0A250XFL3_9CHLO|nr:hypothetical protein CEUSTIGMA_g9293.t1 [Chlamydomonas eustigma]|eukprot:GAX81865.1 hypothetical protein CEUSTIGMA_g9293.t1 [Chlamydomonas eustigma]
MKRPRSKMYAVRRGRSVGLFDNYEEVRASVERFQGAEHKSFSNYEDAVAYLQESGVQVQPDYSVTSSSRHFSQGSQNQTSNDVATIGYIVIDSETDLITDNMENSLANRKGKDCSAVKSNGTQHRVEGIVEDLIARSHTMSDGIHASPSSFYELFFDGASRGNPGEAGSAAVIIDSQGNTVAELYASLPYGSTNNEAEYGGLVLGLHVGVEDAAQYAATCLTTSPPILPKTGC